IATPAAGGEWIEPEPSRDLNISFGGFHGLMMAETVTGAMFYFLKAFSLSSQMQKKKKWAPVKISARLGSLHRARVTVLG
ncbi:MAG: D-2-hydroxyacid dehydrogenase, partial [Nitrospinaceae bacterium]|nr:D-2-hydroxyacid dehydrogenase [Nitrospinaceae bacterium]NIR57648.1 D-2-hydroxyacid dehydrogenase [Nitrospinaceae bacterium]NIS88123.1 D-2-hydroxyacid dehydrogenase [Nitrospinaceae bacterium]NIT84990.1 D-2-hydroxyacid dehydrogenase [Nitrospinaceae bacterium]NIU47159.1 D-2-hydroxyacid dehydrogenase [Nitrospinaceae bacterium]